MNRDRGLFSLMFRSIGEDGKREYRYVSIPLYRMSRHGRYSHRNAWSVLACSLVQSSVTMGATLHLSTKGCLV